MGRKCEISTCSNNETRRNGASFIKFPLDPAISKQWVEFCGSEELLKEYEQQGVSAVANRKICSVHFAEEDFRIRGRPDRGLRFGTVPRIVGCSFLQTETSQKMDHFAEEVILIPDSGPDQGFQFGTVPRMLVDADSDLLPTFVDEEWLEDEDDSNNDLSRSFVLGHEDELNGDLGGLSVLTDKEELTGNLSSSIVQDGEDVLNGNSNTSFSVAEPDRAPSVFVNVWLNSEDGLNIEPGCSYIITLDENIAADSEHGRPSSPVLINGRAEAKAESVAPEANGECNSEPSYVMEVVDGVGDNTNFSCVLENKRGRSREFSSVVFSDATDGLKENSFAMEANHEIYLKVEGESSIWNLEAQCMLSGNSISTQDELDGHGSREKPSCLHTQDMQSGNSENLCVQGAHRGPSVDHIRHVVALDGSVDCNSLFNPGVEGESSGYSENLEAQRKSDSSISTEDRLVDPEGSCVLEARHEASESPSRLIFFENGLNDHNSLSVPQVVRESGGNRSSSFYLEAEGGPCSDIEYSSFLEAEEGIGGEHTVIAEMNASTSARKSREQDLEEKVAKLQRQLKMEKQRNRRKSVIIKRVNDNSKNIGATLKAVRKEREKDRELIRKLKQNQVLLESLNNQDLAPKRRKFSAATRKFTLSMFLCGPRVYRMVKSSKVLTLPSTRTLKRWTKSIKIGPGLNQTILKTLGAKVAGFTRKERVVTICIDGMKIKSSLTYSAKLDRFTGFPDDGINRKIEKNRVSRLATEAVTVMVTGVGRKFKQGIGYFLAHNSFSSDEQARIVSETVRSLRHIGLDPKVLAMDQFSVNTKMTKEMGASIDNPTINVDGKPLYIVWDSPHLIKSTRNMLKKQNAVFNEGIASFDDIEKMFELDSKSTPRLAPRVTEKHIRLPPFTSMNVAMAAQVLSGSAAAAVELLVETGELHDSALETAEFLKFYNTLFDTFNSKKVECPGKVK